MPLQDLTPQLRTRLSRLERLVGLFITAATLLLLLGLGYYVYQMAESKGWFLTKMPYFTFVSSTEGLHVGDRVKLMGMDIGSIVEIKPMPPDEPYNVYVRFKVTEPHYGYVWEDSRAKVNGVWEDVFRHPEVGLTKQHHMAIGPDDVVHLVWIDKNYGTFTGQYSKRSRSFAWRNCSWRVL